jgi:hypothetical protein
MRKFIADSDKIALLQPATTRVYVVVVTWMDEEEEDIG